LRTVPPRISKVDMVALLVTYPVRPELVEGPCARQ
jgi:hypothetical protein